MKATLILTGALLLTCTGAALAQTPDGMPPALETVCDTETGAAFGWCNAYCEAMDCELANDGDPLTEPNASANACGKVRSKFQQSTGRDVPCEQTCPCNDPEVSSSFVDFLAGELQVDSCFTEPFLGIEDGVVVFQAQGEGPAALSVSLFGGWFCGLTNVEDTILPITPEQGLFCAELIEQAAASQGLVCVPGPF